MVMTGGVCVGEGLKDLENHPGQGEAKAHGTLASLQEQTDESNLEEHRGGGREQQHLHGAPLAGSPCSQALAICAPEQRLSVAFSQAGQGRA